MWDSTLSWKRIFHVASTGEADVRRLESTRLKFILIKSIDLMKMFISVAAVRDSGFVQDANTNFMIERSEPTLYAIALKYSRS